MRSSHILPILIATTGLIACGSSESAQPDSDSTFCSAYSRINTAVSAAASEQAVADAIQAHADDLDIMRSQTPSSIASDAQVVIDASDAMIAEGSTSSVDDPSEFLTARAKVTTFCSNN
jgi:hypothetical protein